MLVAVALLPAIALQAYNEFDRRRARQLEVQDHALSLAKLAAADQQQIVQGIRQVLIALSELPSIKSRDSLGCTTYLDAIKQRFPAFITLIVTDLKGLSFCHTGGNHKQVDVSKRAYFASALATGAFTVGEFSIGLSSGRKVILFALPFYDDNGSMGGVIIASLGLEWLADYIAQKGASKGAALAVTDRNGTYLARYPDNDRFVGTKMPGDKYLTMDERGAVDIVDVDGVERIEGYSALQDDSGGLVVSFGLDKAQAFTEIQRETLRDTFLILLSTVLVLALASLGARQFIHRPLGQLVDAANQWRLGEFSRRVDISGNAEIVRVADAFNTMADALEHRERELSKAKDMAEEAAARITTIFESTNDSVLIIDRDWRVSYLNGPAWAQVAEGRDIIGMPLCEAFQDGRDIEVLHQIREKVRATSGIRRNVLPVPEYLVRNQCVSFQPGHRNFSPRHHRTQACAGGAPPGRGAVASEPENGVRRPAHWRSCARLQQPAYGSLRESRTRRDGHGCWKGSQVRRGRTARH
ncbi:cache domain-containing protein [Bradyrhizobium liaoningense]|uniref:cache domain-containing protein n=1 Tax=Bradyrhizobium liaoningense TaxID=43992 RepID=UPI0028A2BCD3|nr:cache domain-containing protein [Bradyrhizobium liaoningense]